jgi:hypothetical protein
MALDGTLGGLKTSIADTLNRSDLTSAIADFVTMATGQLTRRLLMDGPVRQMLGTDSLAITSEYTNLPADFEGLRALYLFTMSNSGQVDFCEPEKIAEQKIMRPNQDGDPQLFSIVGNQIQFWPWNTGTYTAQINYWQSLPALSAPSDTNWLLTKYPDAYLYTALLQSAPYLKDDDRVQVWGTFATQIVSDIIAADKIARFAPSIAAPILSYPPP